MHAERRSPEEVDRTLRELREVLAVAEEVIEKQ